MTKKRAKFNALMDAAMNIEGSMDLIEQRYASFSPQDHEKIQKAYEQVAEELRKRASRIKTEVDT